MKKIISFIILSLFLTGCTSYTELNELSIVNTLGISYENNKYHLTINVVDGSLDDGGIEKKMTTLTSSSNNLEEAFQNIYLESNKKLYLSHIDLLVLTKDSINNHLKDIINNFLENNEYRNNFNVILVDGNIEDFIKNNDSETINNLLKTNEKETGITKRQDLENLISDLLATTNSYLPTIKYENDNLTLSGFTLIKNYQVYEELSISDSIIYNLLMNNLNKAYLNETNIYDNQTIITTNKNKVTFEIITTIFPSTNFKNKTEKDIISFLKKYQAKDYDILNLVEYIKKNHYSYYKDNSNLLSKLTFNVNFKIKEKENYLELEDQYETR